MYFCLPRKVAAGQQLHHPFTAAAQLQLQQSTQHASKRPLPVHFNRQLLVNLRCRTVPVRLAAAAAERSCHAGSHQLTNPHAGSEFNQFLTQLTAWKAAYGTCHVPSTATDASALCQWVSGVRKTARKGLLETQQKQQLDELGFIWKPDTVDALWHAQYHKLRCWVQSCNGTVQDMLQYAATPSLRYEADVQVHLGQTKQQLDAAEQQAAAAAAEVQGMPAASTQQLLLQLGDMHETAVWLVRQIELYGKLKLTPVKVTMLRKLGVKLKRQAGLSKPNLHPVLQGKDPAAYQRRPIQVSTVTPQGKAAVGRLLHWHQQQQQSAETSTPASASSSVGSIALQKNASVNNDPDVIFMQMLAQLQRWKKRYGSCHVPAEVADKVDLAEWVQHVRDIAAAAGRVSNGDNSSSRAGPDSSKPYLQLRQLKPWYEKELRAVGFVWKPSKADVAWHASFHRLRHFKQTYHHLDVPQVTPAACQSDHTTQATSAATATDNSSDWAGLAEWLLQQRQLMAAASSPLLLQQQQQQQQCLAGKGPTAAAAGPAAAAAEIAETQRLSGFQLKLLRSLGLKPAQS